MITMIASAGIGTIAGLGAQKVTMLMISKVLTTTEAQTLLVKVGTAGIALAVGAITTREVSGSIQSTLDSVKLSIDSIQSAIRIRKESKT